MRPFSSLPLLALPLALLSTVAHATVVQTQTLQNNQAFVVANDDLLQTHLASSQLTGNFTQFGVLGASALNNGVYGDQAGAGGTQAAMAAGDNTATYVLDAGNGQGYTLTQIASYSGWDGNRGGQAYTVSYDTVAAPGSYVALATVFYNAQIPGGNTNTRVLLAGSSGSLATGVRSLRFSFADGLDYGLAAYREIDVSGFATAVPEPGAMSLSLAGLGLLGAVSRRRAQPRSAVKTVKTPV